MNEVQRADGEIFKLTEGFFGEYENLSLLENGLLKKGILPEYQYANYLSRIAFCIEIGMKTIINIESGIEKTHHLDCLYNMMPNVFRNMVVNKSGKSEENIKTYLQKIRNIFIEFRYMEKKNLEYFLEDYICHNGNIVFF